MRLIHGQGDQAARELPPPAFAAEQFDADELVEWARSFGHPETWARRCTRVLADRDRLVNDVADLEHALRQIIESPALAAAIASEALEGRH